MQVVLRSCYALVFSMGVLAFWLVDCHACHSLLVHPGFHLLPAKQSEGVGLSFGEHGVFDGYLWRSRWFLGDCSDLISLVDLCDKTAWGIFFVGQVDMLVAKAIQQPALELWTAIVFCQDRQSFWGSFIAYFVNVCFVLQTFKEGKKQTSLWIQELWAPSHHHTPYNFN